MSSDCPSLESALASCIWSLAALTEAGDVTTPPVTRPTAVIMAIAIRGMFLYFMPPRLNSICLCIVTRVCDLQLTKLPN